MSMRLKHVLMGLMALFSSLLYGSSHHPQAFLNQIVGQKDEGEQIVQHFCANCHATRPIIPLGAPRIGEVNDWENRVQIGLKGLFNHTEQGFNAMPPRGGCFECTDDQLILAILVLLPESFRQSLSPVKSR